jgi:hypothetical protein
MKFFKRENAYCFTIFRIGKLHFIFWHGLSGEYECRYLKILSGCIAYISIWKFELSYRNLKPCQK